MKNTDMRGKLPESWRCVDCNTAPGFSTRSEMEAAFNAGAKVVSQKCDMFSEVYTVKRSVWMAADMEPMGGCLCIGCLEKRIGRQLTPRDFLMGHELNQLPGTQRLLSRRQSQWEPPSE